MSSNTVLFGWNRPIPGREKISQEHFGDLVKWFEAQQSSGAIASFEPVFLDIHGGDLNGFFLIRADPAKLDAFLSGEGWQKHMIRAGMHLQDAGFVRGVSGDALMKRFEQWAAHIPK